MKEQLRPFSKSLRHAGFLVALTVIGVAVTPSEAQAASKVCAPDNRGCYYTRWPCSKFTIPKTWTCTKYGRLAKPQTGDVVARQRNGRAVAWVGGQQVFILSDTLELLLSGASKEVFDFAQRVRDDRGAVSDDALNKVSAELGLPIRTTSPR